MVSLKTRDHSHTSVPIRLCCLGALILIDVVFVIRLRASAPHRFWMFFVF